MSEEQDPAALAAGYALGSLTPDERARYEAYLETSADGMAEADAFARVAERLPADVPVATPSADLKARLMAQIAVTPQDAPVTSERVPDRVPVVAAAPSAAAPSAATQAPAAARAQRRWFQRPAIILAAAAAAVVLFAGGTVLGVNLGNSASVTAQQADALAQISAASDAKRTSAPVTGGGTATLVWSNELGKSAMIVDGVAPPPSGKTYQLWYIRGGHAASAGLMAEGTWQVLHGTMRAGDTVGITVEPDGGSKQPTTKPIAAIVS